jgi:hypothetical protein
MACKYDYQWCRRTPASICKFCVADLFVEVAKLEAENEQLRWAAQAFRDLGEFSHLHSTYDLSLFENAKQAIGEDE